MFTITKTIISNEDNEYTAYGIAVLRDDYVEIILSDISPNIDFVNSIVRKCNKYGASPEHVSDIVYDSLG